MLSRGPAIAGLKIASPFNMPHRSATFLECYKIIRCPHFVEIFIFAQRPLKALGRSSAEDTGHPGAVERQCGSRAGGAEVWHQWWSHQTQPLALGCTGPHWRELRSDTQVLQMGNASPPALHQMLLCVCCPQWSGDQTLPSPTTTCMCDPSGVSGWGSMALGTTKTSLLSRQSQFLKWEVDP